MKPDSPIESSLYAYEADSRVLGTLGWFAFLFIGIASVGWWIGLSTRPVLFIGIEMLALWSAGVAIIQSIYFRCVRLDGEGATDQAIDSSNPAPIRAHHPSSYACIWQWLLLVLALAFIWRICGPGLSVYSGMGQVPVDNSRRIAIFLIGCAAVLYFLTHYAWIVQKNAGTVFLNSVLHLSQVVYLACALGSVLTFIFISTKEDYSGRPGWFLVCLTPLLALETLLRFGGRFYLPKSQRKTPAPVGTSLVLDTISGSGRSLLNLTTEMESLVGVKIGEIWVLRFIRESIEAVIFAGVILGWLSTCLTVIPLGSKGVRVSFGTYDSHPLKPGLHLSWPTPLGEITVVETERIREISLGFEQDMGGPLLWTEAHYAEEQNLLVGDGESLLTIDVPVQYRVADPVAFLKATPDAAMALTTLAERKLIQVSRSRDSFQIMTTDREEMASELKQGLQNEVDRLRLGLQIVFVGLKDVHPPVDVAAAYENVISAQEEKETAIDLGKAYEASNLPYARAAAQRLIAEADAAKTKRVDQAAGETARFIALVAAQRDAPALFRERLRYDVLDETLLTPAKIIVGLSGENLPETYLDLRSLKNESTPGITTP
jgi:HflK protein